MNKALDSLPRPLAFVLRHLLIGVPLAAFIALFLSLNAVWVSGRKGG